MANGDGLIQTGAFSVGVHFTFHLAFHLILLKSISDTRNTRQVLRLCLSNESGFCGFLISYCIHSLLKIARLNSSRVYAELTSVKLHFSERLSR